MIIGIIAFALATGILVPILFKLGLWHYYRVALQNDDPEAAAVFQSSYNWQMLLCALLPSLLLALPFWLCILLTTPSLITMYYGSICCLGILWAASCGPVVVLGMLLIQLAQNPALVEEARSMQAASYANVR